MKKIISMILAVLMLCTGVFALVSCGSDADSDLEYIKGKGKLVVGITEYPPMDYKDENGEWIGFDAEFARLFADKIGVEAEFIEIDWDNKVLELSSKSIDCIWNGMTILPEITAECAVSNPYVENRQVVVMKADLAAEYESFDEMKELKFAAEAGSAGEGCVMDVVNNYTAMNTQADALFEVASGASEACVIDATMAKAMTGAGTSYENLVIAAELTNEQYGVAFRKDSDLLEEFNSFMVEIKTRELKALAEKYNLTLAE